MGNDAVLRTCLVGLAAATFLTALCTHSWRKTAATYWIGMLAICGVVLPDWKFFDRPVSQWHTLVADDADPPPLMSVRIWFAQVVELHFQLSINQPMLFELL
ncbi:signal peptidase complex-like protein DTM1 isoform X2 [Andrographis paniculata]|uniref:signal peptidase complex-like protein DTM1 isoform X2 n=1 Tax=Andrographis paniculata TaxID=175694 RepID=UPI0021E715BF|nr:signal peptidase complex-like protein DTM1 isoform X2 [Andrographis paniculata]